MTIRAPRVSVVIPAYNAARFVAVAVQSVLCQTFNDLECIVVDDGSTDGTRDVLARFGDPRLRLIAKRNERTPSAARNTGIAEARGELVALLDADDVWLPEKLERQVAHLDAHSEVALVSCAYAITDVDLRPLDIIRPKPDPAFRGWLLGEANGIGPSSTAVIRRTILDEVGPFRLELSVSEDVDFAARIAARWPVASVHECLALYRTHVGQGHIDLDRYEHDMTWIMNDRFGTTGERDPRSWRRGTANVNTRLFVYRLRSRQPRRALAHLGRALRTDARRVVALPAEAWLRGIQRRRDHREELAALAARLRS